MHTVRSPSPMRAPMRRFRGSRGHVLAGPRVVRRGAEVLARVIVGVVLLESMQLFDQRGSPVQGRNGQGLSSGAWCAHAVRPDGRCAVGDQDDQVWTSLARPASLLPEPPGGARLRRLPCSEGRRICRSSGPTSAPETPRSSPRPASDDRPREVRRLARDRIRTRSGPPVPTAPDRGLVPSGPGRARPHR